MLSLNETVSTCLVRFVESILEWIVMSYSSFLELNDPITAAAVFKVSAK